MEQNLAVMIYSAAPSGSNPNGIPGVWPYQVIELGQGTTPPDQSGNWMIMTTDQYNQYIAQNQATYDAWYAPVLAAQQAIAQAMQQQTAEVQYGMSVVAQMRGYISQQTPAQILAIFQAIVANGGAVLQLLQLGLLLEANTALLAINTIPFLTQPYNAANPTGPTVQQYFSALILAGIPGS